ncbi:MAG: polyphosphate polymerase domain-containing protein [Desulfobacteraceae bacterium]|nr:polyphosphate polymerase domain-containing protein [Desulfobacteraceae bacterium]
MLERYELKYMIPRSMIGPISDYLSIYCSPDKYSEKSEDGFYAINNLYLDSPNFLFLRKRMDGSENRFNMRIRSYNSISGNPCFFEIKQKSFGVVRKYRADVFDENWRNLFETPGYEMDNIVNEKNKSNVSLFYRTAYSYQAEPKVLTRYRRKAYVSDVDEYARATFDCDLCYQPMEAYTLIPDEIRR